MPIYKYRCKKCKTVFEFLKTGTSDTPVCDTCGCKELDKQVTAFSVRSEDPVPANRSCRTGTCSCSGS
ncbi:MAG: hypothetical protein JSW02_11490 [candidate division WOR-3 bacterium]|nr:MAG: hypothetical protein JSW02_11490 [candidate division WOR-3 bacterium]